MAVKKKFINVEIPMIGETLPVLGTPEELNKRTIKLDLSRKLKGRGLEATFVIMNKEGKLVAYPRSLLLMRSYIQRMMRKRVNYVEDSFEVSCKDMSARIKPFLITRKKVSRAIRNNLRKTTKEFILEYVKDKTFLELSEQIIFNQFQKEMHPKLKKVYPLSLCEIRIFETKSLDNADFTIKKREEVKLTEEKVELTQAEEVELHQKKKAEEAAAKEKEAEEATPAEEKTEAKPKKAKKSKEAQAESSPGKETSESKKE